MGERMCECSCMCVCLCVAFKPAGKNRSSAESLTRFETQNIQCAAGTPLFCEIFVCKQYALANIRPFMINIISNLRPASEFVAAIHFDHRQLLFVRVFLHACAVFLWDGKSMFT